MILNKQTKIYLYLLHVVSVPAQEVLKFSPCQFVFVPNLKKLYESITIVGFAVNIRVALFVKARQKVKTNVKFRYMGGTPIQLYF